MSSNYSPLRLPPPGMLWMYSHPRDADRGLSPGRAPPEDRKGLDPAGETAGGMMALLRHMQVRIDSTAKWEVELRGGGSCGRRCLNGTAVLLVHRNLLISYCGKQFLSSEILGGSGRKGQYSHRTIFHRAGHKADFKSVMYTTGIRLYAVIQLVAYVT